MKFALEGKCLIINCIVNEFKTEYDELKTTNSSALTEKSVF